MKPPFHNRSLVISLASLVAGMLMLSYAAVPLYRIFCQVTGFGGTIQRSAELPDKILDQTITVTFNADTDPNLPWKFYPLQTSQTVHIGENTLAAFRAENLSDKAVTGMASYNVTPQEAGLYFHKIACFCFEKQTLKAGEVANMPVSYFIDPEILKDPNTKTIKTITLSYTFFNDLSKNR